MPLVTLPPEVAILLAQWQAVQALTDITNELVEDTRTLLSALTTAPDLNNAITNQATQISDLRILVQNLRNEQQVALETEAAQQTAQNHLRVQLDEARAVIVNLSKAIPAPGAAAAGPRYKIPKPKKFNGSRNKLQAFITQLRLYTATFTDEQAKLHLAVNCLTGAALDHARFYIQNDRVNLDNIAALIAVLENAFGNPNRVAEAESKLSTIQQGVRDFSAYYIEFSRYAAEVAWDEVSKLAALKGGLAYSLKNDLISVTEEPTTIVEFATLCNRLDTRRRALQDELHNRTPAPAPRPAPRPQAATTAPTPPTAAAGPMDLSASRRRLSPEERPRRMAEGRCYRCGGVGHMARYCPLGQRPMRAAEIQVISAPPH